MSKSGVGKQEEKKEKKNIVQQLQQKTCNKIVNTKPDQLKAKNKQNQDRYILARISINTPSQHNMSAMAVQQTRVLILISSINSWSCTACAYYGLDS